MFSKTSSTLAPLLLLLACVGVGQPEAPEAAPEPVQVDPAIATSGATSPAQEAAAARLLAEAQAHYGARRYADAAELATRIAAEYPEVRGSSTALWILARSAMELEDYETAEISAGQYASLLPPEDPRGGEAALVRARALAEMERPGDAIAALLSTSITRAEHIRTPGLRFVRENVREVDAVTLGELADAADPAHPFVPRVRLEYALGLFFRGETDDAAEVARAVIDSDPPPPEVQLAQSILSGGVERRSGAVPLIGAILPQTGSPLLQEYARRIEEGIRVAIDERAEQGLGEVALRIADDGGDPERSVSSLRFLETQGVLGLIGPIREGDLSEVARARTEPVALVSPTAREHSLERGVYSLAAADISGAERLARYASGEQFERIAVVYPEGSQGEVEARVFADAVRRTGFAATQEFSYMPGSTTFQVPLEGARDFGADAIFLPIPESDVELLAPQIAFFGVDSLGLSVLGTAGWAQQSVLQRVDPRHLDGAVVAAPQDPVAAGATFEQFRAAYEALNRRTLRSQIPAFGYDAAKLLLRAIDVSGARSPADVSRALEEVRDFPGATGTLSIEDGRLVRRYYLFQIQGNELIPLRAGFD